MLVYISLGFTLTYVVPFCLRSVGIALAINTLLEGFPVELLLSVTWKSAVLGFKMKLAQFYSSFAPSLGIIKARSHDIVRCIPPCCFNLPFSDAHAEMSPKRVAAATQEKPVQHVQPVQPVSASNLKPGHSEKPFPQQPLLQMVHTALVCVSLQSRLHTAISAHGMSSLTTCQYATLQMGGDLKMRLCFYFSQCMYVHLSA